VVLEDPTNVRYVFGYFQESDGSFGVSSVQKENNRVPRPWGDDMEEALMAQAEAIQKQVISAPRRRWLSWRRSTTVPGLWLIIAILLVWFLLAFATRHSHSAGLRALRTDRDRSDVVNAPVRAALAAWIGKTRLIDNLYCEPPALPSEQKRSDHGAS
jgi:hypothetical protein